MSLKEAGLRGGDEVREHGTVPNTAGAVEKLARKLAGKGNELKFCYEAGPCGYGILRQLMIGVLAAVANNQLPVTPDLAACLSPYTREHIRRFGPYVLDMSDLPGPLEPQPLPFGPSF